MKKFLLMCCLFLGIAAVSHAQGGMRRTPEERAKQLQTQLKLTDDQAAKITAIYKEQSAKIDSLRTANVDRQAFRPVMLETNQKVKAALTAEQATEFEKWQRERAGRFRQGGGNNGGTPPPPAPRK